MTVIFDGKAFVSKKEEDLRIKIHDLRKKGLIPKLISIMVGDNPASCLYVSLKKKAAKRVGAKATVKEFDANAAKEEIIDFIKRMNEEKSVQGIMLQLPLPLNFSKEDRDKIINAIAPDKDVDGLREDSLFLHPTSKAVIEVLNHAVSLVRPALKDSPCKVCVVGASGMVGKPLVRGLRNMKYELWECDDKTRDLGKITRKADVLISATGFAGLIKAGMVKRGVIVIDTGSPKGDVDFESVKNKTSFITPVPGGVGPVTIATLLENLLEASMVQRK